jgi:hypothetical protein
MKTLSCPKCGFSFNPKMSLPSTICPCGTVVPHDPAKYAALCRELEPQESRMIPATKVYMELLLTRCVKSLPKNTTIDLAVLRKQMIQVTSTELPSVSAVASVDEYLTEIIRGEVARISIP